ncbi:MAG TPA: hypothetical protein VMU36_10995, partial [Spirochaetia bacterium]|nr:hypothetical protein [Spirochaetia bacterium]
MNKSIKSWIARAIVPTLALTTIMLLIAGCPAPGGGGETNGGKVVFIWNTDNRAGQAFKDMLASNGVSVVLLGQAAIEGFGFSDYGLAIVGNDTSISGVPQSLYDSGIPIIGLGEGGYYFFGTSGLRLR